MANKTVGNYADPITGSGPVLPNGSPDAPQMPGGDKAMEGGPKVSPAQADYRPIGPDDDPAKRCENCAEFLPGKAVGTCQKVTGAIDPQYTCDLYEDRVVDNEKLDGEMF